MNQVIVTNKITNIPLFSSSKKRNDISVCFVPPINSGLPSAAAQEISNNISIPIQNLQSEIIYIVKVTPTRSGIDGSLLDPCNTAPLFTTITTFRQLGVNQSFNYVLDGVAAPADPRDFSDFSNQADKSVIRNNTGQDAGLYVKYTDTYPGLDGFNLGVLSQDAKICLQKNTSLIVKTGQLVSQGEIYFPFDQDIIAGQPLTVFAPNKDGSCTLPINPPIITIQPSQSSLIRISNLSNLQLKNITSKVVGFAIENYICGNSSLLGKSLGIDNLIINFRNPQNQTITRQFLGILNQNNNWNQTFTNGGNEENSLPSNIYNISLLANSSNTDLPPTIELKNINIIPKNQCPISGGTGNGIYYGDGGRIQSQSSSSNSSSSSSSNSSSQSISSSSNNSSLTSIISSSSAFTTSSSDNIPQENVESKKINIVFIEVPISGKGMTIRTGSSGI